MQECHEMIDKVRSMVKDRANHRKLQQKLLKEFSRPVHTQLPDDQAKPAEPSKPQSIAAIKQQEEKVNQFFGLANLEVRQKEAADRFDFIKQLD